jgi:serine/threonine-protein kinase ULK/ATG1
VLEFCAGGDLGHYLRRYRQVSEATARYFLQQVAEGLKELRRHNVIHVRRGKGGHRHRQALLHTRQQ